MRKALIILGILDDTDLEWFIEQGNSREMKAGDCLIRQGDELQALYFVLNGSLTVSLETPQPRHLAELESGEVVGEISLLDSRPATASVHAKDTSLLLEVNRDVLKRQLKNDVGFQARMYKAIAMFLAQRMRSTILTVGYGDMKTDDDEIDEIEPELLGNMEIAARRFELMISKVRA
ncbi:cyclic nucleotide-binding domain-containing protein [Verrucomicrobia bacterium]|nr:cyclic nucleotide-binding domain-containing protein [Verrucomicrobiota bacterium]